MREIGIWKTLRHPNVLRLYGASSDSGYVFVSPYMKNGNLVQHLKWVKLEERPNNLGIGMGSSQMPLSPFEVLHQASDPGHPLLHGQQCVV